MRDRMPRLTAHLDSFEFGLDLLLTKWLICLFVNHLPLEAELAVWDLFFIKGVSVLFRVAITLFQLMENDILKCQDYGDIFMTVDKFGLKVSRDQLLKNLFVGIRNKEIDTLRTHNRIEVFDMLTEQLEE
jgi:low affinity Fe/Cu permease